MLGRQFIHVAVEPRMCVDTVANTGDLLLGQREKGSQFKSAGRGGRSVGAGSPGIELTNGAPKTACNCPSALLERRRALTEAPFPRTAKKPTRPPVGDARWIA
jgi:hypothetical protein